MSHTTLAILRDIASMGKDYWKSHGSPLGLLQAYPRTELGFHKDRMAEVNGRNS